MDKKDKKLSTQQMLILKACVAAYVAYLGFTLITDNVKKLAENGLIFVVAGAVLLGLSVVLFGFSIKSLAKGEYKGGAADPEAEEEYAKEAKTEDGQRLMFGDALPENPAETTAEDTENKEISE